MSRDQRILYVIVSRGAGTGGHHISLRDLATRMRAHADVHIAAVAVRPPPALDGVPGVRWLPHSPWRVDRTMAGLVSLCRELRPTVIHSYDGYALRMARVLSVLFDVPLVHTQCGGPTAKRHVPRAPDVVVFSTENLRGMSEQLRMRRCRLHHIPNRVEPVTPDPARVEALRAHLGLAPDDLVVMRVNRFVAPYEPVMRQTLALAERLRLAGLPARAVLLGSEDQPQTVARIAALAGASDRLVHDPRYTRRAAELLPLGDLVVGTGRGLMEAASLARPIFASVAGRTLPALVDEDTLEPLFDANFSPRAVLPDDDEALAARALAVAGDPARRALAGAWARRTFETRFDVAAAVTRHLAIYANAEPWPRAEAAEAFGDLGFTVATELYHNARHLLTRGRPGTSPKAEEAPPR